MACFVPTHTNSSFSSLVNLNADQVMYTDGYELGKWWFVVHKTNMKYDYFSLLNWLLKD